MEYLKNKYGQDYDVNDLILCELKWQKRGLMQTATGYGNKLTTRYKLKHNSRLYRVYAASFSNCASYYIVIKGEKKFLNIQ